MRACSIRAKYPGLILFIINKDSLLCIKNLSTSNWKSIENVNLSTDLIGFDFGLTGGLGYSMPNGLTFEARFKQGFVDIFGGEYSEDSDGNVDVDQIYLNQLFQLGISYTFDVK